MPVRCKQAVLRPAPLHRPTLARLEPLVRSQVARARRVPPGLVRVLLVLRCRRTQLLTSTGRSDSCAAATPPKPSSDSNR
jgi:hypothetical protein